jgi:hypothetical protein
MNAMKVKVAQNARRSSRLHPSQAAATIIRINGQNENPPRYQWPWFVLAAFLLGVALAIVGMSFAVHREKQERAVAGQHGALRASRLEFNPRAAGLPPGTR